MAEVTDPDQVRLWFLRGSPGFEIVPELAPREDEAVLDKIAFSAFEGTPLALILRDCGLSAFAIVGIAIEIGIDPTVRHGSDLGLVPIVVQDACGAGDPEAAQRALANLAFMEDAMMTDTAAFCAAAGGKDRGSVMCPINLSPLQSAMNGTRSAPVRWSRGDAKPSKRARRDRSRAA